MRKQLQRVYAAAEEAALAERNPKIQSTVELLHGLRRFDPAAGGEHTVYLRTRHGKVIPICLVPASFRFARQLFSNEVSLGDDSIGVHNCAASYTSEGVASAQA
jgi:hypothetical protein